MEERSAAGGRAGEDDAAAQPSRADAALRGLQGPARALLIAWLIALVALTLMPVPPSGDSGPPMSRLCLVCGDRGAADAILNLLFFVPLGMALAHRRRAVAFALLAGTALSVSVELAQFLIPGRYPTFGDVVWNGLGAALGALAVRGLARQLGAPSRTAGPVAALLTGVGLALAGWLLGHAPTAHDYYGQWTADLGYMPHYGGTLVSASLDGLPVPNTRFPDDARPRERLAGDWTIAALVVKGPAPSAISPIVSITDSNRSEILVLGAHGEDLVLRERTRAKALLLDHPDVRLEGGLARFDIGDTIAIRARRVGQERYLSAGGVETRGLGFTPGRTWGLLLYLEGVSEPMRRVVDTLWLLALLLPVGMLTVSPRSLLAHGVVIATLAAVAIGLTRLVIPPWWEILGALAGLVGGWLLVRRARTHLRH